MPSDPGVKNDNGKTQLLLLLLSYFPRALEATCDVSTFGAEKYCPYGWESVDSGRLRYSEALIRHVFAEVRGEEIDPDSGLYHDAHVAWNALARLELRLREREDGVERGTTEVLRDFADSIVESRGGDHIPPPPKLASRLAVERSSITNLFSKKRGPDSHKEIDEYTGA